MSKNKDEIVREIKANFRLIAETNSDSSDEDLRQVALAAGALMSYFSEVSIAHIQKLQNREVVSIPITC